MCRNLVEPGSFKRKAATVRFASAFCHARSSLENCREAKERSAASPRSVFRCPVNDRACKARSMKIDRDCRCQSTDRFVKILFEIASAGIEDAQPKSDASVDAILIVVSAGRDGVVAFNNAPSSTSFHRPNWNRAADLDWCLFRLRDESAFKIGFPSSVLLALLVFDFELQRESRLAVDCRSFASLLFRRTFQRGRRCRFSRQISPSIRIVSAKGSDS